MQHVLLRVVLIAAGTACRLAAADLPEPIRLCTLLENLTGYEGKVVVVVGRFSFRENRRTLSEDKCGNHPGGALRITFDKSDAPPTPERLDMDGTAVRKILKSVQQQTSLSKFKFGTADYDRWAVIYARVQNTKSDHASPHLVCAGDSVLFFLVDRE